ncbi:MAG: Uma2 family endonuclease [Chloroflexi bacterium]|nr:Uma2 family endonuclease [Chloroflexota bacterium]
MTVQVAGHKKSDDDERLKELLFSVYGHTRWTDEQYLGVSERTNRPIELSEGRLIVLDMPTSEHQDIVGNIYVVFRAWAQKHGGRAFVAAMPVRLWPGKFREPDVMLYTAEHRDRVSKQYGGPPDLAVEVLSPSTEEADRVEKMAEYAQAGIGEYWIVGAEEQYVEQYVLEGERYRLHARVGAGETLRAATITDLEAGVDSLYEID